jgi:hypothetical protein
MVGPAAKIGYFRDCAGFADVLEEFQERLGIR